MGDLVIRCWADAECAAALTSRIDDVLDLWDDALLDEVDEQADIVEDLCHDDPRNEYGCDANDLRNFVEDRESYLRPLL